MHQFSKSFVVDGAASEAVAEADAFTEDATPQVSPDIEAPIADSPTASNRAAGVAPAAASLSVDDSPPALWPMRTRESLDREEAERREAVQRLHCERQAHTACCETGHIGGWQVATGASLTR